jgi:hypothetical protein
LQLQRLDFVGMAVLDIGIFALRVLGCVRVVVVHLENSKALAMAGAAASRQ